MLCAEESWQWRSLCPQRVHLSLVPLNAGRTHRNSGTKTCAGRPGSQGYETKDAQFYADSGVSYLKEDSCSAPQDHPTAFAQYGKMRDALNATGRPIFFSLCGWNNWYAPVGKTLGNSWRISGDCNAWPSIYNAIRVNQPLFNYSGPGAWVSHHALPRAAHIITPAWC